MTRRQRAREIKQRNREQRVLRRAMGELMHEQQTGLRTTDDPQWHATWREDGKP